MVLEDSQRFVIIQMSITSSSIKLKHIDTLTLATHGLWFNAKSSLSLNHFTESGCVRTHLHSDDGVDEEQHGDEQADVWQSLKANANRL